MEATENRLIPLDGEMDKPVGCDHTQEAVPINEAEVAVTDKGWSRPYLLTTNVIDVIAESIKKGLYVDDSCTLAGISRATYYSWLAQAEAGNPFLEPFVVAIQQAEAELQQERLAKIGKYAVARDSWEAEMTFLERRFPKKWARQSVTTHAVDEDATRSWKEIFGWYKGTPGNTIPETTVVDGEVTEL